MLNNPEARNAVARLIEPPARGLLRIGLTPDAVTYLGAIGTSAAALWFFPRGQFVAGVLVILLFVFSDLLDGTMARLSGRAGPWGNYLDSTLDRVADGAVFGSVLIYFAMRGEAWPTAAAWICLVGSFTVSYAKARAESVGATANVGLAERAERFIVILLAAFVQGLWPSGWILAAATGVLALLTLVTIMQRFAVVRRQLLRRPPPQADSSSREDEADPDPGASSTGARAEPPQRREESSEASPGTDDGSGTDRPSPGPRAESGGYRAHGSSWARERLSPSSADAVSGTVHPSATADAGRTGSGSGLGGSGAETHVLGSHRAVPPEPR